MVVDYGLARRAALADLFSGGLTVDDACDAHPYLLRAAKYHGEPTEKPCPVCQKERLTHVTYVYGEQLGRYAGRVKATRGARWRWPANLGSSGHMWSKYVRVAPGTT